MFLNKNLDSNKMFVDKPAADEKMNIFFGYSSGTVLLNSCSILCFHLKRCLREQSRQRNEIEDFFQMLTAKISLLSDLIEKDNTSSTSE